MFVCVCVCVCVCVLSVCVCVCVCVCVREGGGHVYVSLKGLYGKDFTLSKYIAIVVVVVVT